MGRKKITIWVLVTIFCIAFLVFFKTKMYIKKDKHVIILTEKSSNGKVSVKSKLRTPYKMVVFLDGTLNDTIFLDGEKIPPSRVNKKIYDYDWYSDSAWFYFDRYKATKVNLKLTYIFYQ